MSVVSKTVENIIEDIKGQLDFEGLKNQVCDRIMEEIFGKLAKEYYVNCGVVKFKIRVGFDIVKTREEKSGGFDFLWISLDCGVIRGSVTIAK